MMADDTLDTSSLDTSTDDLLIDVSAASDGQNKIRPPLCGFLAMHNKAGMMKSYKSRWFVYSDDSGKLLYYKNKGETVPEGEILITHATFTFDAKEKPGVFEIRIDDTIIALEASGREEMFLWLQELQTRRKDFVKQNRAAARTQVEQIITSREVTSDRGMIRQDTEEGFIQVSADDLPRIVYTGGGKPDSNHSAAINKLSHNVSKAADTAKVRLSSLFNRKSNPTDMCTSCESCRMMEEQVQTANEDSRMAREELSANQHVLKMLHNKMDLLLQEIHTLENVKKIYEDPQTASAVEREKEHQKLLMMVSEMKKENEKLSAHNIDLVSQVSSLKEHQTMCQETILSKDAVIVSLSEQIDKLTASSGDPSSPPSNLINLEESYHESVKDKLEAFELQNKFLNKEILELHFVRLEDQKQLQSLNTKHIELEARFYQLHSKYLLVLNEMNKPQIDESGEVQQPDDLMSKLLEEAMTGQADVISTTSAVELRESLNSSFRAARKYDSYGFEIELSEDILVQAANLQTKSEQVLASMHETPEAMSMRVKWENFLAVMTSQEIQRSVEFKNLIRAGIPKDHREKVWNILINFHVGRFRNTVGPQYYEKLLKKHSRIRHNPMAKQIELDLRRTLPNNKYFEKDDSDGIPKLRRILLAYSYHNPVIGYCQGMNRVAAFALLFLKEEDAFWCLVAIIDFIMPQDYFSISMVAAQADQRVLRDILREKCPRVTDHLDALEMDISLFSFNWFLTLFIENIPIPTVLRIWDAFLCEGIKILFRYATAFFKSSEEGILKADDYISANNYLKEMGPRMGDTEKITYVAFNSINPFPIRMINAKRAMYLEQVKAELRELNALREEFRNQRAHLDYQSDEEGDNFDDL